MMMMAPLTAAPVLLSGDNGIYQCLDVRLVKDKRADVGLPLH